MLGYKKTSEFLKAYLVILILAVVAFLVRLSRFDDIPGDIQVAMFAVSFVFGAFIWELLRFVNNRLNAFYPYERNVTVRIILQLIIGVFVGLAIRAIIYFYGEPHVPIKLDSLFVAATWVLYTILPSLINLGFFASYFFHEWKKSIVHSERLEKEKAQVQFDNLRNQLNPHFLFNALTSLNTLIFENQELASQFLQQLSKVYRYVLQHKDKNFVLIETELEFITHYIRLLETRFGSGLQITIKITDGDREKAIIPVTLQILIENAIKHNVIDASNPLRIDINTIGDYLIVSNNIKRKKQVESSNRQGMDNLKSLYSFMTSKPVLVEETEDRFFVKIPLLIP